MANVQHTCTGCVPIDASILETYIALINANNSATAAAERAEYAAEHAIGKSPYIGENGNWWEWSDEQGAFIDTMVQAHSSIAVDTQLDPNSTNPVQNKVTTQALAGKQDAITDLPAIRSGAAAGATAYQKPASGVPASDMASGVQTSLGKADTAYQKPSAGIPKTDLAPGIQTSLERADESAVRPYNAQSPNGMGYLVLEKDKTFASQVTDTNTIYEIRYHFALSANFTMPSGCVLRFDGGKITGPFTLTGTYTKIDASRSAIFGTDISISGTWDVIEAYPEWFGALGDGANDDRLSIQKTLDSFPVTKLSDNSYALKSFSDNDNRVCLKVPAGKFLIGSTTKRDYLATELSVVGVSPLIIVSVARAVKLKDIAILGNVSYEQDMSSIQDKTVGVGSLPGEYAQILVIDNVLCRYCYAGFDLQTYLSSISSCIAGNCYIGFHIHGDVANGGSGTSVQIRNCYANVCQSNGYFLQYLSYSSVVSCGADYCGQGYTGVSTDATVHSAYRFYVLKSCTICSIGTEASKCVISGSILRAVDISQVSAYSSEFPINSVALIYITGSNETDLSNVIIQNGLKDGTLFTSKLLWLSSDNMKVQNLILKDWNNNDWEEQNIKAANFFTNTGSVIKYDYNNWRLFGTTAQRPPLDYIVYGGFYYDTDATKLQAHTSGGWKDYDGETAGIRRTGTNWQRPASPQTGFQYFDTYLGKAIWYNGSAYVDGHGQPAVRTSGPTSYRPAVADAGEGFMYYDTDLKKMILCNGTAWVNVDGTALS